MNFSLEQASLRTPHQKAAAIAHLQTKNKELAERVAALEIAMKELSDRLTGDD